MDAVRYVITEYTHNNRKGVLSFSLHAKTNKMDAVHFSPLSESTDTAAIGDIFVAKVTNVVQQLNAAFIDYAPNQKGYLPIRPEYAPVITNRKYNGRILAGDEILVQMEKEAVRTKEPVFTTNLSLAGRYSVVSSANTYKGVSRKCTKTEKEQLRAAIPQDMEYGVVIRTNAAALLQSPDGLRPITEEIRSLNDRLAALIHDGIHRTCYSRIWTAAPSYLTNMRDEGVSFQQIITDSQEIYETVKEFAALYMPEQLAGILLYQDASYPLHKLYRVETQLDELLCKKVWLRSGAYLILEKTEAMYVIDVNSGKNITKKTSAEYIFQINLEAAGEIMRQIRLRNLTGMILVDFINMEDSGKENELLSELRLHAKKDRILTTVVDITALGLVEITRKKTTKSLAEQLGVLQ